jgi:replicative DNA helicase
MEDQTGLTIHDIVIRAKRHKRDFPNCKLIAVDHIGLMNLGKIQTRHDLAVGEITKELKNLAKEIETPVVILSQLTGKQIMQRPILEREPRAQDIKDSSRIEEDADLIIMLHRQYTHDEKAPNIAEWILAKARHAIKGTKVYFRFVNGHFSATDQAYAFNEMDAYKNSLTPVKTSKPANLK